MALTKASKTVVDNATNSLEGVVRLSTNTEAISGQDATTAMTPLGVKLYVDNAGSGGGGDVTSESDMYMDLLSQSGFLNASYDGFRNTSMVETGSTTMTWDVVNYEYDFTAGQVLISKNLYDTLITSEVNKVLASVDYTDSGSFTIQASRDGGNTWETIGNNDLSTLTTSTTATQDLRVKMIGGGTGSVYSYGILYNEDPAVSMSGEIQEVWMDKNIYNDGDTLTVGQNFFVDSAGGSFTLNLPPSAGLEKGDTIQFLDASGNCNDYPVTIGRNGSKIMGQNDNLSMDANNIAFKLVFDNITNGWRFTDIVASSGIVEGVTDVNDYTTTHTVTTNDSNRVLTNEGATGSVTFSLSDSISVGSTFTFVKAQDDQDIVIDAPSGHYIVDSTSGGTITCSTSGEGGATVTLVKGTATQFFLKSAFGTWVTA